MKKRIISALLAAMLSLSAISLAACSPKDDEELDDTLGVSEYSPNIPEEVMFEGETMRILIGSSGQAMWAEEENSDLINDTVYRNNATVADRFGITLDIQKTGAATTGTGQQEATARFRSLIEAGDQTYNAFIHVQHTGMPQMILEKFFVDWNTIPYINLSEPWWYQNITNDLCFGDKIYVMTGDYALYINSIDCLVFNKDIFDDLGLEYPYQDVLDGTWTWDKFVELVKQGAKDLNGDGLMKFEEDQWGLVGWQPEILYALLVSSGFSPLEKDADNMPVLNQNVDEAHEIYDKISELFINRQYAWSESSSYSSQMNAFTEGRAMFKDLFLSGIPGFKEVEFDFGILPYPKWTEDAPYLNRSSNMTAMTYIPVTNPNLELTGAVLEEMAYQAYLYLTPAYFDTVLTVKSTRDVESEKMLPIIKDNARFLYDGYCPNINHMVYGNNYASQYAANLSKYETQLEEMRELLEAE